MEDRLDRFFGKPPKRPPLYHPWKKLTVRSKAEERDTQNDWRDDEL